MKAALLWSLIEGICIGLAAFWVFAIGPFAWILRDGLGPAAIESEGWPAVGRMMRTFEWGPVSVALTAIAGIVNRLRKHRRSVA